MATLRYAGVAIEVLPGQGTRTLNVAEQAQYSEDGLDYLWHDIIIEAQGIVNPSVIAVTLGATVGNSLWALQDALKQPRQELTFDISADRVIQAPPRMVAGTTTQVTMTAIAQALAAGVALPGVLAKSDCNGGPFPEELKIIEVQGTHSALIYFRIRCSINLCNNIVLANRWSIHHHIDELHYTVRTISGNVTIRRDIGDAYAAIQAAGNVAGQPAWPTFLTADAFRASVIVNCPSNFQRESVDVHQGSDDYTLEYTVIDREKPLNSAANFPGLRIEGNATSGYQTDLHGFIADVLHSLPDLPGDIFGAALDPWGAVKKQWDLGKKGVRSAIPIPMANALVRAYGDRTSAKYDLASIALNVIVDRFTNPNAVLGPIIGRATTIISVISCYLTQDVTNRMCEVRMELIPHPVQFGAFLSFAPASIVCQGGAMNLANTVVLPAPWVNLSPSFGVGPFFGPVAYNQTIGTYAATMLTQLFNGNCTAPAPVPAEPTAGNLQGHFNVPLQ